MLEKNRVGTRNLSLGSEKCWWCSEESWCHTVLLHWQGNRQKSKNPVNCFLKEIDNLKNTGEGEGLPRCLSGKESACQCRRHSRHGLDPWMRKNRCRRKQQATSVFLPESPVHGNPSGLRPMAWQGVRQDWATERARMRRKEWLR